MCGIAGLVLTQQQVDAQQLASMRDTFSYRGPDDAGAWISDDGRVGLGHRRLSIIDTSKDGHQPMEGQHGAMIVFNGEIYNYVEIRRELQTLGHQFKTKTDTEVILKSYEEWGERCVHRFNGMFAIALWDASQQALFMWRDRLGIKPFYYIHDEQGLCFASEVKALRVGRQSRVQSALIDQYMSFGYVPGEHTLLEGIHRLLPGHMARFDLASNRLHISKYWDLPTENEADQGLAHYLEQGRSLLNSAIDLRLRSDVPLGIFLSGGIDSSAVVGLLAERTTEPLKTYSVAYDFGRDFNETPYARMVSERFGTDHHELFVKPEDFRDFIPEYVHLMDEPVTESAAISLCLLSKMTTQDVTVVLSGEGSDEIFAGYDLYRYMQTIEKYRGIVGPGLASAIASLAKLPGVSESKIGKYLSLSGLPIEQRYKGISTYDERIKSSLYRADYRASLQSSAEHRELNDFLSRLFQHRSDDPLSQMLYFDTKTWLVDDLLIKADRMSMAASLELRVPFLDYRLVEFASRMPNHYKIHQGQGKFLLKEMVKDLLPNEITYRKKMGFPTPLKLMFQGGLRDYSHDLLLSSQARINQYFNTEVVRTLLQEHNQNKADHHRVIWQLVVLEEWLKQNG